LLQGLGAFLILVVAGTALHTAFTQGDTVFAGKRPSNLGVTEGRLAPSRRSPNCVSSQTDTGDKVHYISPISFAGSAADAMARLRTIVDAAERTRIVKQDTHYLYAEYKSKLLGFVDDVEFLASEKDGVIHVRSASRLGRRDFGVNRYRIESIRAQFAGPSQK
jgi:uncharacterized protein (DUF1499 family)